MTEEKTIQKEKNNKETKEKIFYKWNAHYIPDKMSSRIQFIQFPHQ